MSPYDPWSVYGDPLPYYPAWYGVPRSVCRCPGMRSGWELESVSSAALAGACITGELIAPT